jgi:hypothetical protein
VAELIAPEFVRFIADERRARRLPAARAVGEGEVADTVRVAAARVTELLRASALRAAGLARSTKRTEVVWVEGDSELAVNLADLRVRLGAGLIVVAIPVRCDQAARAVVEVAFVCGAPDRPAGLYAAAERRPRGPELVVATWGDALVAFAWQCLLGMLTGVAGAAGKDRRGNALVPVELTATAQVIEIVPMARYRFGGTSGLKPVAAKTP